MIPAFAYLRVSGKSQLDGDGFPRQREAIASWASAAGIEIVAEFVERAVPGKTEWEDRPAWAEMMAQAGAGTTILIESLNRLARDLMVQEHIIADLRKRGITLISAAEPDLCVDDPSRKLLRQIMGAIAEYDRAMIVLKLRGARRRNKAAGLRGEGRVPFGGADRNGVIRRGEAEALVMMRQHRDAGHTYANVAVAMNQSQYKTRYGKPWIAATIQTILRREEAQ